MRGVLKRTNVVLNDRRFFRVVLIFFVLESAWIALSAAYPQAFDENFHFGLIKVYTHYWLPFLSSQPPGADTYSAVARDPSYLYHYLMSFPYRLLTIVTHSQTLQVIVLRLINVTLAATGLVLFRRVLLRARVSRTFANASMLIFVLIPIVPQLAGQVNYDNLLLALIPWCLLVTFRALDEIKSRRLTTRILIKLATICTFTSLVKYEFLPIFVSIVLFLLWAVWQNFQGKWQRLWPQIVQSWRLQSRPSRIMLVAVFILSVGCFIQRDGVNLIKYHTLAPNCNQVLTVQACSAYSPWEYGHIQRQIVLAQKDTLAFNNPITYTGWWIYWLWYRLFFAVNGPPNFTNFPPLPLPAIAGGLLGVAGTISICIWGRRLLHKNPYLTFFLIASLVYLAALWLEGYTQYRSIHVMVLMNGRYLLPVLLLLSTVIGQALAMALRRRHTLRASLAALVVIFFLQGGGVLTFIMRSDATWDWPGSAAIKINNATRTILRPIIIEGSKTYTTHEWFFN